MASRQDPQFKIRVPETVVTLLDEAAHGNRRSVTREIEARLMESFDVKKQLSPGMNLREHFAGLALQGMLASQGNGGEYCRHNEIAKEAVWYADALIAELSKGGDA